MTMTRYLAQTLLPEEYDRLGGETFYNEVPEATLARFATHPGRRLIVYHDYWQVDLFDVRGGYKVYDRNMVYRYSVVRSSDPAYAATYATEGDAAVISTFRYGVDMLDQAFARTIKPGEYFYVMHDQQIYTGPNGRVLIQPVVAMALAAPCSIWDAS